jgi:signal transduction histidine kinase/CheY-like chemotaxis protein
MIAWYAAQALERARLYAAEQRARSAAEARQRRSAFLAESDTVLATLDYQSILLSIASVAVPRIADWCIVEIEEDRRQGRPAIAMHADPAKNAFVLELSTRFRAQGNPEHGIPAVIRTGRSQLYRTITPEQVRAGIRDRELAELYISSGVASSMVVPIMARGDTLGALLLNSATPTRSYDEDDLAMAEELGRRVGLAIENARLYRDAREADHLKDEFLAMLSHELRTPLVPIVAAVDLMALHDREQFVQERGLIRRNAHHLVRLLDDLLDVSRITRGKISLSQEYCKVADLVSDGIDLAYPLIEQARHRLLVAGARHGMMVYADRVRIAQAIANLLTNAARYTEPGGTITVTAEASGGSALIRVRDTGIGIAPEVITRIFDIFVQAPDTQLTRKGGLGIGLTIVKRIVELHGGSVSANSAGVGHGSELVIRLPLTSAEHRVMPKPPELAPSIRGGHVLVVDDNHDAAAAIAQLTRALGFSPHVAHDGFAALELATTLAPDLAFLDLGLPRMDGYELARRLRILYPSLRIVAVTGFGQPSDRERSQRAGFADHIVKPVTLDDLRSLVQRLTE